LGINAAAPGFEKIIIKPQPVKDLRWAKGSYQSIRGKISSDWKIDGKILWLNVLFLPIQKQMFIFLQNKMQQ